MTVVINEILKIRPNNSRRLFRDTILYYTILYYTILYYTILYYTILYYTILWTQVHPDYNLKTFVKFCAFVLPANLVKIFFCFDLLAKICLILVANVLDYYLSTTLQRRSPFKCSHKFGVS